MLQRIAMQTAAGTSASYDSTMMIPNKFYPPKSFVFPKCFLDQGMKKVRSGQSGVRNTAGFLVMSVSTLRFVTYTYV